MNSLSKAGDVAKNVLSMSYNSFLDSASFADIGIGHRMSVFRWFKLDGYRALKDADETKALMKRATKEWITGNIDYQKESVFLMVKDGERGGIYFGSNGCHIYNTFIVDLPEAEYSGAAPLQMNTSYNGYALGSMNSEVLSDTIQDLDIDGIYVACMIIPIIPREIEDSLNKICECETYLNPYRSFKRIYGSSTRQEKEIENTEIVRALEKLAEKREFLKRNRNVGAVRTILKFGAKSESDLNRLMNAIRGCIIPTYDEYQEPLRILTDIYDERSWEEHLYIPDIRVPGMDERICLLSMQSVDSTAGLCSSPLRSGRCLFVKNYNTDENSKRLFEGAPVKAGGIYIGRDQANEKISIPADILCCHAAVFGSAGGGKTTTVKRMIKGLYECHVPVLVIEAAKKEYFELGSMIKELNVYTPGMDGKRLIINPLEPEEGTFIENQVDMLVRAVAAAHGNEHPIPEAFEGLLKLTYEKAGWSYGMIAYEDPAKPFPTFADVYANIDEYVRDHAHYGAEVRQNLIAALTIRSENLYSGALGQVFGKAHGMMAKELLNGYTVLELDDFSESATTFLMNVIMYKLKSYLSKRQKTSELRRVIVIEEAHNIFRNTRPNEADRDINNQYFERMLSEIRASGTGLIISDQRPSVLSEAVIANSAVKMIHAMEERSDRDVISSALDMSEIQNKRLRELVPGECIMSLRGSFGLHDVFVDKPAENTVSNVFCNMCSSRFNCRKEAVKNILDGINVAQMDYHISRLMSCPYNPDFVRRTVNSFMDDLGIQENRNLRCCLLGEMLAGHSKDPIPTEVKRMIVNSYFNT